MYSLTEKKLIFYTATFIAVILNISKLLALRENGYLAQYWHFNGFELLFQSLLNFAFCVAVAFLNLRLIKLNVGNFYRITIIVLSNILLLIITNRSGIFAAQHLFHNTTNDVIFRAEYFVRMLASLVLTGILVKMILMLRQSKAKDKENDQLREVYLQAQLELLKEELNPHFFFNALSSLSAIVREDPKLAQQYISHLSKIFRYTLNRHEKNLVPLSDELAIFNSYASLQKMRMEETLEIKTTVPPQYLSYRLPYMSLQPLLENAAKHNSASAENPLTVSLCVDDNYLVIKNNLQEIQFKDDSTGIGVANLNERFRILVQREIVIEKTENNFIVKLPLLK
jgi:sensor histidine kinase YesM